MVTTNITGGRWQAIRHKPMGKERTYMVISSNKMNICTLIQPLGMSDEELVANATLIDNAPDMLQALLDMQEWLDNGLLSTRGEQIHKIEKVLKQLEPLVIKKQ